MLAERGSTWRTGPVLVSPMRPLHRIPQCPFLCARLFESFSSERCYKKMLFPKDLLFISKIEQNSTIIVGKTQGMMEKDGLAVLGWWANSCTLGMIHFSYNFIHVQLHGHQ